MSYLLPIRRTTAIAFALITGILFSGTAIAAGKHSGGHGHHGKTDIGVPGEASKVTREITITMRDSLYEPAEITVHAGETIRFTIVNKGELLHEFGIGTAAMHAAHQKEMLVMAEHGMIEADRINHERMKMNHGNGHGMAHDDPNSVLLEPGKSGEIIWTFSKGAKIEFACNVPGHYEAGMIGRIKLH